MKEQNHNFVQAANRKTRTSRIIDVDWSIESNTYRNALKQV